MLEFKIHKYPVAGREPRSCFITSRAAVRRGWRSLARSDDEAYWSRNTARRSDAASDRQTQATPARGYETASNRWPRLADTGDRDNCGGLWLYSHTHLRAGMTEAQPLSVNDRGCRSTAPG
jgi:hypothetical protein